MASRGLRRAPWPALLACLALLACRPADPAAGLSPADSFRAITERELPAGVEARAHADEVNDNFIHTTHYWLLAGKTAALRSLADGTGFARSDDDARHALPDVEAMFGLPPSDWAFVEGYEWELDHDRWLVLLQDGGGDTVAVYAH